MTQELHMIKPDTCYNRYIWVVDINAIQPPAHTNFKDVDVGFHLLEKQKGQDRIYLEKC